MKQIPVQLLNSYKKQGRSTCFLVKIVDNDGGVEGFTTLDAVVVMNDGVHNVEYDPEQELRPQNIQNTADMDIDNTQLRGWFNEQVLQKVTAGALNGAEITIYRVNYLRLQYGFEVVAFGSIGTIEYAATAQGHRKVEFRSLTQRLKQKQNPLFSLTCRHDFGDENCGMPFEWENATVDEVDNQFLRFRVIGVARPDDWFNFGIVEFLDGENQGKELEVEEWTSDGWIKLAFVAPRPVTIATQLRIRRDCGKTETDCKNYGNILNNGSEYLTPVQDQSLMVPGAYIKSSNAL